MNRWLEKIDNIELPEKLKLFIVRDGVDTLIGVAILLIVGISAFTAENFSVKNLMVLIPLVLATVGWYVARMLNRKNGKLQQQKEMHDKLLFNVEHDLETGHYDYELRMKQLQAYRQTTVITDDEYRTLKARYEMDRKKNS